jgi:hypothetical protein
VVASPSLRDSRDTKHTTFVTLHPSRRPLRTSFAASEKRKITRGGRFQAVAVAGYGTKNPGVRANSARHEINPVSANTPAL